MEAVNETNNLTKVLLEKKLCSVSEIKYYETQAAQLGQNLFQYLVQHQIVDAIAFANACSKHFEVKQIELTACKQCDFPIELIKIAFLKNHLIMPIKKENNELVVAICNPNDLDLKKDLAFRTNHTITLVFVRFDTLIRYHNDIISQNYYNKLRHKSQLSAQTLMQHLLSDAIHRGASDIHFEPYHDYYRVRIRIDGMLHEVIKPPSSLSNTLSSCLKVNADLDIAIKRTPQDGRFRFHTYLGFIRDCRVSTCPTLHGEKIVIRLLDANTKIRGIDKLGLLESDQKIILKNIQKPQGLILVTGPTGSGKTMTLYTLLNYLNQLHCNIATAEDPVEVQITGINQTHINNKAGFTFSKALRTFLRQDPDIIMIGEIRDKETAEMAIRAAQTGHLVFSTLHTNSASEAITRLLNMGIAPFNLASAATLIIAQRLVRKLCRHCKTNKNLSCTQCTNGFYGRHGIFELLAVDQNIKQMILNASHHTEIAKKNSQNGHKNLWQSALQAVQQGLTSLSEIYRVIPNDE